MKGRRSSGDVITPSSRINRSGIVVSPLLFISFCSVTLSAVRILSFSYSRFSFVVNLWRVILKLLSSTGRLPRSDERLRMSWTVGCLSLGGRNSFASEVSVLAIWSMLGGNVTAEFLRVSTSWSLQASFACCSLARR
eukprot:Lithocolla_globosa_v1_NODE_513_length_3859_cov_6.191115.p3 type:complete len:137 gc:universal NODE_513_length_3859_cov_6.191115:1615-1205(-)